MATGGRSGAQFSCKHCPQKCPTRYDLMLHRKSFHAGEVLGEHCKECSMSFRTLTELKRHSIAEHSNRPFSCSKCLHRSKTQDKLERHILSHTSPRDSHHCQFCDKKFVFKNSMTKHLEKGRCDVLKQRSNTPVSFTSGQLPTSCDMQNSTDYSTVSTEDLDFMQ
jgi:KRAB domain-containing zinc finger protein